MESIKNIKQSIDDAMRFTFVGIFIGVMSYFICSLPPSPNLIKTEYINDNSAFIKGIVHSVPSRNGIEVSTEYGNYYIWDYDTFCKYKDANKKQVTVKFKKDYYDNDTTRIQANEICDIELNE